MDARETSPEQQSLEAEFAAAEGAAAERRMLHTFRTNVIEDLAGKLSGLYDPKKCKCGPRTIVAIIHWFHMQGAIQEEVPADPLLIGDSSVVQRHRRTVEEAMKVLEALGILRRRPAYDENGRRLFPPTRLDWGAVLAVATGRPRGAVPSVPCGEHPPPRVGASCRAGSLQPGTPSFGVHADDENTAPGGASQGQFFPVPAPGGLSATGVETSATFAPAAGGLSANCAGVERKLRSVCTPVGGQSANEPLLEAAEAWRDWRELRLAATALLFLAADCSCCCCCKVFRAQRTEVMELADEAARLVGPRSRDPEFRVTLVAAAVEALLFFNRYWLISAAKQLGLEIRAGGVKNPRGLFRVTLADNCVQVGGMKDGKDRAERRHLFGTVNSPIEQKVEQHGWAIVPAAPAAPPETAVAAVNLSEQEYAAGVAEQRDILREVVASMKRHRARSHCPAPGPGEGEDQEKALETAAESQKGSGARQGEGEESEESVQGSVFSVQAEHRTLKTENSPVAARPP
jgi:hypothetical protein